ncbi:putative DNA-binding transcriptional regulator AlpA [Acidovorax delafieldii]|uniref:DNA-binding transcriptional regulator AlpA n=1 Tax=Acidovorax delafieldii TaxID=47920 RepID=A0AAJ2BQG3_ACIDE|nr:AlpA family phage regulatory protein [Acidovorax delafieldii]MDR6766504.1 putative DNA-binding transcriptional regulator AlpA [Acidovorax delafieldii]MDR6836558.1 putative DNA-binding transcriptional regulator AlpA [Acidovorax delafieldii]MDR7366049.1 putative DNA-binding transcriptional regulator AlpA [Acidovorax delafieldii]
MKRKEEAQIKEDQPMPSPTMPRLLTLEQVLELTTISRSTWYRGVKARVYPQAVKISARRRAWREDQIARLVA